MDTLLTCVCVCVIPRWGNRVKTADFRVLSRIKRQIHSKTMTFRLEFHIRLCRDTPRKGSPKRVLRDNFDLNHTSRATIQLLRNFHSYRITLYMLSLVQKNRLTTCACENHRRQIRWIKCPFFFFFFLAFFLSFLIIFECRRSSTFFLKISFN